jgi:tRNA(Arg) A34 adenosine deaminase TadA
VTQVPRSPDDAEEEVRRVSLQRLAGLVVVAFAGRAIAQDPPAAAADRRAFVARAFEMRRISIERGDQSYGAVVVKAGRIVGEGISAVVTGNDPTAHAEMQAIRDAARRLGTRDLAGCELYGTARACTMCEAAAYWARVSRMYFGEAPADAGVPKLP